MPTIMVEPATHFHLKALPRAAMQMLGASWQNMALFVAGNTLLGVLGATVLSDVSMGFLITLFGALALYCVWLKAMYRSVGLGDADHGIAKPILRLMWAHILVAFILAVALSILMLGIVLALQVMLIAAGMNTDNFPETTDAFMAFLVDTGVIWPAGALLALMFVGFLCVRLWLFSAATIDHGGVRVFQTWPWTKGNALALSLAVGLFVVLPLILGEAAYRTLFGWPEFTVQDDGVVLLTIGVGEALLRALFQSLEVVIPAIFAAAISATAYGTWGQSSPGTNA